MQKIKWGGWFIVGVVLFSWAGWLSLLAIANQNSWSISVEERDNPEKHLVFERISELKVVDDEGKTDD